MSPKSRAERLEELRERHQSNKELRKIIRKSKIEIKKNTAEREKGFRRGKQRGKKKREERREKREKRKRDDRREKRGKEKEEQTKVKRTEKNEPKR